MRDLVKRRTQWAAYRAGHLALVRERERVAKATWRIAHQAASRAYQAAYYVAHRDEKRTRNVAYYEAHREEEHTRNISYRITHREERRESQQRRRARIRGQFVEPVDAQAIYERDGGICHLCGELVERGDASMDHVVPISLGGEHSPRNVKLSHLQCNLRRGVRPLQIESA